MPKDSPETTVKPVKDRLVFVSSNIVDLKDKYFGHNVKIIRYDSSKNYSHMLSKLRKIMLKNPDMVDNLKSVGFVVHGVTGMVSLVASAQALDTRKKNGTVDINVTNNTKAADELELVLHALRNAVCKTTNKKLIVDIITSKAVDNANYSNILHTVADNTRCVINTSTVNVGNDNWKLDFTTARKDQSDKIKLIGKYFVKKVKQYKTVLGVPVVASVAAATP